MLRSVAHLMSYTFTNLVKKSAAWCFLGKGEQMSIYPTQGTKDNQRNASSPVCRAGPRSLPWSLTGALWLDWLQLPYPAPKAASQKHSLQAAPWKTLHPHTVSIVCITSGEVLLHPVLILASWGNLISVPLPGGNDSIQRGKKNPTKYTQNKLYDLTF